MYDYRAPWRAHIFRTALADAVSYTVMTIVKSAVVAMHIPPIRGNSPGDPVNANAGGKRQESGIQRRRRDVDHGERRNRAVDE